MIRTGHGYDVHRFKEGRKLILGGVEIPYDMGLEGHSDADVLAHAAADSILGALALGDIGVFFPDDDPRYENADSIELLGLVAGEMSEKGYVMGNIDCTIICQKPRLRDHIPAMRENIAAACGCNTDRVSVKATTEEGLGFTGSGEGIAVHAVCLIIRNDSVLF